MLSNVETRGIILLEIALKVYERVIERRIRERIKINNSQFGLMQGEDTIDTILIIWQVYEKVLEGNNRRCLTFVDLEKAFDQVPRAVVYWGLRRKGITEKLVQVIVSMSDGAKTAVRSGKRNSSSF
jgi:hypothetical protein